MSDMTTKWLSRKLILVYVIVVLSFIALMAGKIGGTEWVTVATLAAGVYTYGNLKDQNQQADKV